MQVLGVAGTMEIVLEWVLLNGLWKRVAGGELKLGQWNS